MNETRKNKMHLPLVKFMKMSQLSFLYTVLFLIPLYCTVWRVGQGREPWERSEAGGVIGNERHLRRSPVSSPMEELRKG